MSGRPTAVLVAVLRSRDRPLDSEAADRLAELEVKLAEFETDAWSLRFREMAAELAALLNALPPCPTCGGTQKGAEGMNVDGGKSWAHCPDCIDGKVSIEQLAALWDAIHNDDNALRMATAYPTVVRLLRAVKP